MKICDDLLNYLGCYYLNRPKLHKEITFVEFIHAWERGEYRV